MEKFTKLYSMAVLGTGNNNGIYLEPAAYIFKSYYKLRACGNMDFTLFFVNNIESTGNFPRGTSGGEFVIRNAYAAVSDGYENEEARVPITFGQMPRKIAPDEEYKSDTFNLTYDKKFLVLTFEIEVKENILLPTTSESMSTGRIFKNGEEIFSDNHSFRPCFIGVNRPFTKTVGIMGDSITQGTSTRVDAYEAWAHRIGGSLDEDISFWNLGMGWSRAYDAAADGIFLQKAAMCDELFICFGVNDLRAGCRTAAELICDLENTEKLLKKRNPDIKVIFMTVPPFNMTPGEEKYRKEVNRYITANKRYFDIASVLEDGCDGAVNKKFMSSPDDSHPNGEAGKAVFDAFLNWRNVTEW